MPAPAPPETAAATTSATSARQTVRPRRFFKGSLSQQGRNTASNGEPYPLYSGLFGTRYTPQMGRSRAAWNGEGGIRTLEGGIHPPNALAGRRLQPLGHFSGASRIAAGVAGEGGSGKSLVGGKAEFSDLTKIGSAGSPSSRHLRARLRQLRRASLFLGSVSGASGRRGAQSRRRSRPSRLSRVRARVGASASRSPKRSSSRCARGCAASLRAADRPRR
jgi:hypothetical protein